MAHALSKKIICLLANFKNWWSDMHDSVWKNSNRFCKGKNSANICAFILVSMREYGDSSIILKDLGNLISMREYRFFYNT